MNLPLYHRISNCSHPQAFKYYLREEDLDGALACCAESYGDWIPHSVLPMRELRAERFLIRAPDCGNPLVILFDEGCGQGDIEYLHRILRVS